VRALHAAGLLHRDLALRNALLERTADGALVAKVCDFGFASFSLFECLYLVIAVSDSNDLKRTMVLQVILGVNMFASLVPRTRLITFSHLECP
jgi:serine/threonine protein kinase